MNESNERFEKNPRKKFSARFLESLVTLATADVVAMLIKWIVSLVLLPVSGEIAAREDAALLANWNKVLSGICLISFFVTIVIIAVKTPNRRTIWLNASYGLPYRFSEDLRQTVSDWVLPDVLSALILGLPQYAVLLFVGDVNILPMVFAPFYGLWQLLPSPILCWILMGILTPAAHLIALLVAHRKWDRTRLRRNDNDKG
ncbi:MAG: hypothetical protein ACI3YK_07280 [Eubacteriales bacterium]